MPKRILSKKREKWAEHRYDVIFSGEPLRYNASISAKYVNALEKLVARMTTVTNREILKLFKSRTANNFFVAQDENIASQARILTNELTEKFNKLFGRKSSLLARAMLLRADRQSKSSVLNSMKKLSGGLIIKADFLTADLKTIMKASITENVALIKSISEEYSSRVQKAVMRSITTGDGLATLAPALKKYEGMSKRKAKNIALDQTRKVYSAINLGRMEKLGVEEFTWIHSGGGAEPRPSHVAMNGKIFSIKNPPQINKDNKKEAPVFGFPAQAPNCKCIMAPVFRFKK